MSDDLDAACDEVWHGANGADELVMSGCAGCHYVAGAAVALGLIGMAEAIRARPRYTWKLVMWFKKVGGSHTVSWYATEEAEHDAASQMAITGPFQITKEEVERCYACG